MYKNYTWDNVQELYLGKCARTIPGIIYIVQELYLGKCTRTIPGILYIVQELYKRKMYKPVPGKTTLLCLTKL